MNKFLAVNNISKDFTDSTGFNVHLLEDVSFDVQENSITSIVAPTGAGKSSLLKIISGLEIATSGKFEINSKKRRVVYIPSKPSSFPWYDVKENISIKCSDEKEVSEIIKDVGLEGYEPHIPNNKSLAFRFRIALGRAIAAGVDVIALDEPFSKNIKPVSLERLYSLVLELKEKRKLTFILGTSNLSEAVLLSDKIYTMQKDPGTITNSFDIKFGTKRDVELMNSPEFLEYRNKIETELKKTKSQSLSNITI